MEILSTGTKKEVDSLSIQRVLDTHSTSDHPPATAATLEEQKFPWQY